jgi:hypothetical protein
MSGELKSTEICVPASMVDAADAGDAINESASVAVVRSVDVPIREIEGLFETRLFIAQILFPNRSLTNQTTPHPPRSMVAASDKQALVARKCVRSPGGVKARQHGVPREPLPCHSMRFGTSASAPEIAGLLAIKVAFTKGRQHSGRRLPAT